MLRWNDLKQFQIPSGVALGYVAALTASSVAFLWLPAIWLSLTNSLVDHTPHASPNSPVVWVPIVIGFVVLLPLLLAAAFFFTCIPF
jgi:hypothetical protein